MKQTQMRGSRYKKRSWEIPLEKLTEEEKVWLDRKAEKFRERIGNNKSDFFGKFSNFCSKGFSKFHEEKSAMRNLILEFSQNYNNLPQELKNNINRFLGGLPEKVLNNQSQPQNREEIFRFNGGRWFNWLPSIQVVSQRRGPHGVFHQNPVNINIPQEMVQQLAEIFPHVPVNVILEDLRRTHSIEVTTENIIEGRVIITLLPSITKRFMPM